MRRSSASAAPTAKRVTNGVVLTIENLHVAGSNRGVRELVGNQCPARADSLSRVVDYSPIAYVRTRVMFRITISATTTAARLSAIE
ncbi:hypothetical protein GCM10011610_59820 [Nocardia rhizosphaerihabitans]|uniref:Uncharacterized protein n=1 Tax=Nocardia rhizosphaerihabitans TaxID=1691570 RepID=A0ABQ2KXT1_9NOCA|nr:hypothetical protein GCM10011610_59820 [Nocardia rhizosphaerihabitans]